jgi:hypothetical protein
MGCSEGATAEKAVPFPCAVRRSQMFWSLRAQSAGRVGKSLNMTDDQHTLDDLKKAFICDPEHWRTRAEEARILANEMNDSKTKDAMLQIADEYEHLARWVEDWAMRRLTKN